MNPSYPCPQVSYVTWRLQVLKRLCAGQLLHAGPRLPFLQIYAIKPSNSSRRNFHESTRQARGNVKDVKRSARHKEKHKDKYRQGHRGVQLELNDPGEKVDKPLLSPSTRVRPSERSAPHNPYADETIEGLQDLVGDLHGIARGAARTESVGDHELPFSTGARVLRRKIMGNHKSPLEYKPLLTERERKLRVHEVETDKRLENNVWAQILSSSLRMDRGSRARLPRDLMVGWGAIENPMNNKDYILPIELSDMDALRYELQYDGGSTEVQKIMREKAARQKGDPLPPPKYAPRIQITPDKLLLQAMTEEFIVHRTNSSQTKTTKATSSAKVASSIIPFRWRYKQEELQAFFGTRQKFNEVLKREPDPDEPDTSDMAKYDKLQWQPDITDRLERILRERVSIVLEALAKDNSSKKAIRDRKVLALPVPQDGALHVDEEGRMSGSGNTATSSSLEEKKEETLTTESSIPEWVHGSIFLHVGTPQEYLTSIEKWHKIENTSLQEDESAVEHNPHNDLIPPMITINQRLRLPVFNLETLFGKEHVSKINDIIAKHEILQPEFWHQYDPRDPGTLPGRDGRGEPSDFTTNIDSTTDNALPRSPSSPLEAGEQVLSSILTPEINKPPNNETITSDVHPSLTSSSSAPTTSSLSDVLFTNAKPQPQSPIQTDTDPKESYLILIKARAKHCVTLGAEVWQLWRYIRGRAGIHINQDGT